MGDEGTGTSGKRRNGLSILLGIVGAVLGFVGALALAPYNRMDPIASGMIALFVFGPMGAVAGAFLGAKLGMRGRGGEAAAVAEAATDTPPATSPPDRGGHLQRVRAQIRQCAVPCARGCRR